VSEERIMQLGIVGLPNVGKSTLFKALTNKEVEVSNYPFCTISSNVGIVEVPDERLNELSALVNPEKVTPAVIEFIDIAGLVKGAHKGEGLGNQFLSHIREVSAIIHLIRLFVNDDIAYIEGEINSVRDAQIVNLELILADLATVEKRLEKVKRMLKTGDKKCKEEVELLGKIREHLNKEEAVRRMDLSEEERIRIKEFSLLTSKPVIYVANVGEEDLSKGRGEPLSSPDSLSQLISWARKEDKSEVIPLCAKLEEELRELPPKERGPFLQELGIGESGLDKLVKLSYKLLNLITFFTIVGEKEVRAWTVKSGTKALKAAGKVHSDMEKGFIKAEVIPLSSLIKSNSWLEAREKGLIRAEGKDYLIQDGDVVCFRFKV